MIEAPTFSPTVAAWIAQYGYLALGVGVFLESAGLPIPGETALLAAAFAAAHGGLSLPVVILIAAIAGIAGDNVGYAVGRHFGRAWAARYGRWILLSPARIARMDDLFARYGPAAVVIARFVAGVRVAAAFAAGVFQMRRATFLIFNALGAVLWATVTGVLGYALGKGYASLAAGAGNEQREVAVLLLVAAAAAGLLTLALARDGGKRFHNLLSWGQGPWDTGRSWARALGWHQGAILAMSAGATLVFAKVTEDVAERETTAFDTVLRNWSLAHRQAPLDTLFSVFTFLGSAAVLIPMVVLTAWWLWRHRGMRVAAAAILAPAVAAATVLGVKYITHRARPAGALLFPGLGYSFPSGHTTASTAVLITIAYISIREGLAGRWLMLAAGLFAVFVGLSRVYLDVHWASDVIGGWAVGLGIALICALLYERLRVLQLSEAPAAEGAAHGAGAMAP